MRLLPRLHLLQLGLVPAYLWCDADSLTLVDTGVAGSGPAVAEAIRAIGRDPGELRRIVLTHFHEDHSGSAAEIAAWHDDVEACAHGADADVIEGRTPPAPPDFADAPDWEREPWADIPPVPPAPPVRVDRRLTDCDTLHIADGAEIVAAPGHTPGSLALFLPGPGVLFTGDTAANVEGRTIPGVFNQDRAEMLASVRRLSELDADTACSGHGEPLVGGAAAALRAAAAREAA